MLTIKECIANGTISETVNLKVGLLRYGEIFATQQNASHTNTGIWLITKYSSDYALGVNSGSSGITSRLARFHVLPVIHIKSDVKILSGSGTELDPYIVV